ncbi:MAG: rhomboid family intramembrane serine protease [Saprospiraceae bacterium]|nr:rhomboid family intramembrane serine protease [Saprospiraceae bacterium]
MGFNNLTDVVKNLLIINIVMYLGSGPLMGMFGGSWEDLVLNYFPKDYALQNGIPYYFQPYQIVTHMFMHANTMHLFFNMFALFMFGPILEMTWGPKRFLTYYFFTAFGALLLHTLVSYFVVSYSGVEVVEGISKFDMIRIQMPGVLGASGAVFGLLLGYGIYYPNNVIQLLIPPIPLKAKYFVMIYAALELFLGVSGTNTGVAHFAHLGGALFGLIMIWYWRRGKNSWQFSVGRKAPKR